MINVKDKTCEADGCMLRPNFNILGETKGRFCAQHKQPNMIDVSHTTCEEDDCMTFIVRIQKRTTAILLCDS